MSECNEPPTADRPDDAPALDVEGGSTYDPPTVPTVPTVQADPSALVKYYALRLTTPHADYSKLQSIICKHCKSWICAFHGPHGDDEVEKKEHFHFAMLDMSSSNVDAMRKSLRKSFDRSGNAFMSGKFMDNTVYKAIQYFRHEPSAELRYWGSGWLKIIDDSPEWEEREAKRPKVELTPAQLNKQGFPTLGYTNLLRQALRFNREHNLRTSDLRVVLSAMTTDGWQPSQDIMRKGLDPMHFRLYEFHAKGKVGAPPNWWDPKTI